MEALEAIRLLLIFVMAYFSYQHIQLPAIRS